MKSSDDGLILSRKGEELFQASLTGSTGMLYHVQCAPHESGMAYLASSPLSMHLWHLKILITYAAVVQMENPIAFPFLKSVKAITPKWSLLSWI